MAGMPPPHADIERYTPAAGVLGVLVLAAAFYHWWLLPVAAGLFAVACLADTRELYLFGPFLGHELRRMTRRVRNHLWRPLIALATGLPVLVLYFVITQREPGNRPTADEAAVIATGGFLLVFWFLFILTMSVLTTYLTYAVAEDRESKRQDFLLVTDLRGRELVLGKMFARILGLLAYPAAAVPVILLLPTLFRVDPAVPLYAFGYAGVTLFSIAGLSGLGSVVATTKKAGGNIFALVFLPYLFLIFFASQLRFWPEVWFFPGSPARPPLVSVGDVVEWVSVGNPLALGVRWFTVGRGGGLAAIAADFPAYAAFHTVVGGFAFLYAARMIRRTAANRGEVVNPPAADGKGPPPRRPVGEWPVYWKEAFCHHAVAKARENPRANRLAVFLLAVLPAGLFLAAAVSDLWGYGPVLVQAAKFGPMMVAWIAMMSIARFGLESIAREREKDTLLTLVSTPMDAEEIIREKLWGLLRLLRGTVAWQLMLGVPAVLNGAYQWWAYPGLVLFQLVWMFVMAAYGLSVSATAPNVETAAKRFGLQVVAVLVGGLVAALVFFLAIGGSDSPLKYTMIAVVPVLGILGVGHTHIAKPDELPFWAAAFVAGLVLYGAVGYAVWRRAVRRFVAACDPNSATGPLLDNRTT